MGKEEDGRGGGEPDLSRQPLLGGSAFLSLSLSDEPASPPLHPARLSSLAQDSVLVTGRMGRLQTSERYVRCTRLGLLGRQNQNPISPPCPCVSQTK